MINKLKIIVKNFPLEGYIWVMAISVLAFVKMDSTHLTVCPFHNIGIDFCPGCGLGKSIYYSIHFEFYKSLNAHPLGMAALILLLYRIFILSKQSIQLIKQNYLIN